MLTFVLFLISLLTLGYFFLKKHYDYWKRKGVPGPEPTFLVGNVGESFLMKRSLFDVFAEIYHNYKHYPFAGVFRGFGPALVICDPDLIKEMTVQSFGNFHDNDIYVDKNLDPIFSRNPFCLKGDEWKVVRSQLTPGFTSGKMKWIYPLLEETSQKMIKFIEDEKNSGNEIEAKKLCSKFTLNNVANCAFGIDAQAFSGEDSEFQQIAKQFFESGAFEISKFFLSFFVPAIAKLLPAKFIKKEVEDRLTTLVTTTLKFREDNNIVRNDFLHILNELKKNCKEYDFTDVDVTAHAAGFFLDGFETSATAMSFVLYNLATNLEVQMKLRKEVIRAFEENEGKISYEVLQSSSFLDAVVNESLRMHPPLFSLGKICTKDYTYIPKPDDGIKKPVIIEKGTSIILPLSGLHYDPKYFKNPDRFDPDRFLNNNRDNIVKCSHLPFGNGPRACLGQRFGLLQVKIGVAYIIKNFELELNSKTKLPLVYDPTEFLIVPKGGLWINFKKKFSQV